MSLFQCENCGCIENTAVSCQGVKGFAEKFFNWDGIEDRKGKLLCSECAPTKNSDMTPTEFGKWHGRFTKKYLPFGEWETSRDGNLKHKITGEEDYTNHVI